MSRVQQETEEVIARAIRSAEAGDYKSALLAATLAIKALSDQVEDLRKQTGRVNADSQSSQDDGRTFRG